MKRVKYSILGFGNQGGLGEVKGVDSYKANIRKISKTCHISN